MAPGDGDATTVIGEPPSSNAGESTGAAAATEENVVSRASSKSDAGSSSQKAPDGQGAVESLNIEQGPGKAEENSKGEEADVATKHGFLFGFTGPIFKVIADPNTTKKVKQGEEAVEPEADMDYLKEVREIISRDVDTDKVYGVTESELVRLPFDPPKMFIYMLQMIFGVISVSQAVFVMFILINVEMVQRAEHSSRTYSTYFLPMAKVLLVIYPAVVLWTLNVTHCERVFRRFMYYRLMSLRILVDWTNVPLTATWFLIFFIASLVLLNVYFIYGIAWFASLGLIANRNTSLATWGIVNIQAIHLLVFYLKTFSSEKNLVSLNKFIERDPIAAEALIDATYVIDEDALRYECSRYLGHAGSSLENRFLNLLTCGLAGNKWQRQAARARFDINRLKAAARNLKVVQGHNSALTAGLEPTGTPTDLEGPLATNTKAKDDSDTDTDSDNDSKHGGDVEAGGVCAPVKKMVKAIPAGVYRRLYATNQSIHIAFTPGAHSWPFRPDVRHIRTLLGVELICMLSVAALLGYGIYLITTDPASCSKGVSNCSACLKFQHDFTEAQTLCTASFPYSITYLPGFAPPPPGPPLV